MKLINSITLLFLYISGFAQTDTLKLSAKECEAIFLKENLTLLAEKLQIDESEAELLQAKLWPNPNLTVDQVNLWVQPYQLDGFGELPGLNGDFGRNQQFGISIEQLIITAGKRKKLMAVEQVSVEMSKQYFNDVLRGLKVEFRNEVTTLVFLQAQIQVYQEELTSLNQLINAYKNQVDQGHVARGEYLRLKALQLEIAQEVSNITNDIYESQGELKSLMRLPPQVYLSVSDSSEQVIPYSRLQTFSVDSLLHLAMQNRPDLQIADLEENYFNKRVSYEKSQGIPDVNLIAGYDRGGSFILDFFGVGFSMDIPAFDRNQGNIQKAKVGLERSQYVKQEKVLRAQNQVVYAYQNLLNASGFQQGIDDGLEKELDQLLSRYTTNFKDRNLSLLEYLDFLDAFLNNKQTILEANRNVRVLQEELIYQVGSEIQ